MAGDAAGRRVAVAVAAAVVSAGALAAAVLNLYYWPLMEQARAVDGTLVEGFYVRYDQGDFQGIIDQLAAPEVQRTVKAAWLRSLHDRLGVCRDRHGKALKAHRDGERVVLSYRVDYDKGSTVDVFSAERQLGGRYLLDAFPGSRPPR